MYHGSGSFIASIERLCRLTFGTALLLATTSHAQSAPTANAAAGLLTEWSLSPPARISEIDFERYPTSAATKPLEWTPVKSDATGWVDVSQHRSINRDTPSRVFAKTSLHGERAEVRAVEFVYSGSLSVYLNGQIVFRGQPAPGQATAPSGTYGTCRSTVWLTLAQGANELMLAVSSEPGRCAFTARDLSVVYQHQSLTPLWELAGVLRGPESVAIDAQRGVLYVSNFSGNYLSKVSLEGKVLAAEWVSGLKRPTGLKLFRNKLFVVERGGVAEIDPTSGTVTHRQLIEGAVFPNDLVFDSGGVLYLTDSVKGRVYRVVDGAAALWLEDPQISRCNGVAADSSRLLLGVTSDGTIKTVDFTTRQIATLAKLGSGALMDGLVSDGRGGWLFSDYFGRIFLAGGNGNTTLLLDRTGPHQFCADFDYLPEQGLLIVPSLYDNRLTAYRLAIDNL